MTERVHLPLYGQLKEHVSFSELRLFNECEWKWVLTKILGQQTEERSYQMDYGKAVHSGMEVLYGRDGTVGGATEHALKLYDEALSTLDLNHPSDRAEAYRIRDSIPSFYRDCMECEELKGITTLRSELALMQPISRTDGLDIKFKGFIDIVFVKVLPKS